MTFTRFYDHLFLYYTTYQNENLENDQYQWSLLSSHA